MRDRLQADGVDLAGYTLPQRVDDLEAARRALGYDRIDLVSESAGTRTAMIYAWRHPKSIHRSVMIGVNPPGHFLWTPRSTDEQIGHYADLCATDDGCSRRTDDLAASMRRTAADIPDRWVFLPIKEGNVRVASFFGLMETTSEAAPLSAPMTLDSWLSAAEGDASGFWFHVAAGRPRLPDVVRVGRAGRHRASRTLRPREALLLGRRRPRLDPRQPGHRLHLGRRRAWPTPGRRNPDDSRVRAACGRRTSRRS